MINIKMSEMIKNRDKNMKYNYSKERLFVGKVKYSELENVSSSKSSKSIIRDIKSVSDFLKALTSIISNYLFVSSDSNPAIMANENLFALDSDRFSKMVNENFVYRGQSRGYKYTIPGIYRGFNTLRNEEYLTRKMKVEAYHEINDLKHTIDKLALMQHYGLPTRVLDITTNALVALYFSVSENLDENGEVIILKNDEANFSTNDLSSKRFKNSSTPSVSAKANLSIMTYDEKVYLDHYFLSSHKNDMLFDLFQLKSNEKNLKIITIIKKIYSAIYNDIGVAANEVKIADFYGLDFVFPNKSDTRIVNQNGGFIVNGLDYYSRFDKQYQKNQKDIKDLIDALYQKIHTSGALDIKEDKINTKQVYYHLITQLKKDNENLLQKIINYLENIDIFLSDKDIEECILSQIHWDKNIFNINEQFFYHLRQFINKNSTAEKYFQEKYDNHIYELEVLYSPTSDLAEELKDSNNHLYISSGQARIIIEAKYKQYILNELNLIGINRASIYSDLNNISQFITELI